MGNWDRYFSDIAKAVATRATCPRLSVGCVLVRDHRILTTGYNGAPRGLPHCTDVGCLMINNGCYRAVHSECNAVIQAALHGVSTLGATAYVTHQPCLMCSKILINAGITRVVFSEFYGSRTGIDMMSDAGVIVRIQP